MQGTKSVSLIMQERGKITDVWVHEYMSTIKYILMSSRLLSVFMKVRNHRLMIVAWPILVNSDNKRICDVFCEKLCNILNACKPKGDEIMLGNMNKWLGVRQENMKKNKNYDGSVIIYLEKDQFVNINHFLCIHG